VPDHPLLIGDAARAVIAIAAPDEAPYFDELSAAFFARAGISAAPAAPPASGDAAGLITDIVIATFAAMPAGSDHAANTIAGEHRQSAQGGEADELGPAVRAAVLAEKLPPITADGARLAARGARDLATAAGLTEDKVRELGAAVFAILLQCVAR
jgi:hypothetical protein